MAAFCLIVGLAAGYLIHGSKSPTLGTRTVPIAAQASRSVNATNTRKVPSLDEMKQMADKQAVPLLTKLKNDPNNVTLLMQLGAIYHTTHQFKEAASYYGKAVQADPGNVVLHTKLASSLYRSGDADEAIAELNKGLSYDPRDASSLFDLGMIRLQAKGDGKGALAAWRKLLKLNPQLSEDRKATVQKLMAEVLSDQQRIQGAREQ
jgi:cytochrome c-type biogenesis protein CcmH/NrfG